ncbi:hypothetical protein [Chryseobacterium indoltheticum]|uniref:Uncharacterized protein n=1 Tax=Chryseobacterium indoltheticum TaxID=254 RepID=A0A381JR95_9FLAO|nr:hypothetical protein [Chryseobacterium indoltheticum]AZA75446.1 hypothetical protein EG358_17540 [Chryseobacterium indoltheticum]SIQ67309.1 hypothetical protein SAMN05421682_10791 [Chryseobacterium indoltheticum]SUY53555.1 Uncharacterised protein [Chryseobacterium indoltheticum]
MTTLNREEFTSAISEWKAISEKYQELKQLISTSNIFEFGIEQIQWLIERNKYNEFCVEVGVYKGAMILILCPIDEKGFKIEEDVYPFSSLAKCDGDIRLLETKEYTIVKHAVLSNDLRKIDDSADTYFPIANVPLLEQDKVVAAIESWRNDGMDWFYNECEKYEQTKLRNIFERFYVPNQDFNQTGKYLDKLICSFGLKYSAIFQQTLVTLIFISYYKGDKLGNGVGTSMEMISNTYDWSRPCPPICRL